MMNRICLPRIGWMAALSLSVLVFSCTPDEPEPVAPTDPKQRFVGDWLMKYREVGSAVESLKDVKITDEAGSRVKVMYFHGFNQAIYATISGDSIKLDSTNIQGVLVYKAKGYLLNDRAMKIDYIVDDGDTLKNFTSTLDKK